MWCVCYTVVALCLQMGLNEALPKWLKEDANAQILRVSDTSMTFTSRRTHWGIWDWGIRRALIGVGFPPLSGVSYGKVRSAVHDLDSGDVDGESGTWDVVGSCCCPCKAGDVWCGGAYIRHKRRVGKREKKERGSRRWPDNTL